MQTRPILAALALALAAGGAQAQDLFARAQTAADQDDVYFIAQLQVDDMEGFQARYVPETAVKLGETSALVLAVTPEPMVVEGEWQSNWTVLMRFEDMADFEAFYEGADYQERLIPERLGVTSVNNVVILQAFDPAVFGG